MVAAFLFATAATCGAATVSFDSLLEGRTGSRDAPLDADTISASLQPGDTLIVNGGHEYFLAGPLRLPAGVVVDGTGGSATLRFVKSKTRSAVTAIGAADIRIIGLRVVSESSEIDNLLSLSQVARVAIRQSSLSAAPQAKTGLVRIGNSQEVIVENSRFTGGYEGIEIHGNSSKVRILGNTLQGISQYGIRVEGDRSTFSRDVDIFQNIISDMHRPRTRGAGHGIYVHIGENVASHRHRNVQVNGNTITGIDLGFTAGGNGDLIEYCDVDGGSVSSNNVSGGGDVGLAVIRSANITVRANTASKNNTNGIVLWESDDCVVSENVVFNNNQDRLQQWGDRAFKGGIRIMGRARPSRNNRVENNRTFDNQPRPTQDYGVYVMQGSTGTVLQGNTGTGNRFGFVRDESR